MGADRTREITRWVIRDIGAGWFAICDKGVNGKGHAEQLARAFSRGRAEIVRDALEDAWPLAALSGGSPANEASGT